MHNPKDRHPFTVKNTVTSFLGNDVFSLCCSFNMKVVQHICVKTQKYFDSELLYNVHFNIIKLLMLSARDKGINNCGIWPV